MSLNSNKLIRFWQELVRRRVVHFLIAYLAACLAIIEFFDITKDNFSIPGNILKLIYIIAAIGLPLVIILPWIINRKKPETEADELSPKEIPSGEIETIKHNLPSQLATFIGREKEMQVIKDMISEHRLVTLTGSGGCGKTRLACEVAIQLVSDFKDGVWFVDLSPIANEDLVAKEITEALKIAEVPNKPIIDTLIEKISDQNLLIILDNCEHLIKTCSEITGKLGQSTPGLKILATSRQALGITGEKVWRVPSLTLIDPQTIIDLESANNSEAVMLFSDRARLNNSEFELVSANVNEVVAICNKLDGIPLAVELVASRTRHMDPHMILERYSDQFDQVSSLDPGVSKRQHTLQATIEWSYNLLSENEKLLFARLSVFCCGFDIPAAEEVCSDDQLPKESILEIMTGLADRSLVYSVKSFDHATRYNRPETLRQFAQQKLQLQKEEEVIRKRHALHYVKMAEQSYEEQFELQVKWMKKLEVEHDNMIAALNWSEFNLPENFKRIAGALHWFWRAGNHFFIGSDFLERAVSLNSEKSRSDARIMFGVGLFSLFSGEIERMKEMMSEGLKLIRQLKHSKDEVYFLGTYSSILVSIGDHEKGIAGSEQCLKLARQIGKPGIINFGLMCTCGAYVQSGKYNLGRPLVKELLASSESLDYAMGIKGARHYGADCAVGEEDFEEGEQLYALALETALKFGDWFQATTELDGIAFALSGQSRWAKSIRLDAAAHENYRIMGVSFRGIVKFWDEWNEKYMGGAKKEVGEELARKYEEEGIAMGFDKAVEYALDFDKD